MQEESIESKAQAYDKLKELLDRGYAIRLTRQSSIETWDIYASISAFELCVRQEDVVTRGGCDKTLIGGLEAVEPQLADWQISKIRQNIGCWSPDYIQEGVLEIRKLQPIADRLKKED